jgi:hypothetical protein
VPTLIVGAENDTVARVGAHAEPFYTSLPSSLDDAYPDLNAGLSLAPTSPNETVAKYGPAIQEYRDTCPPDDLRPDRACRDMGGPDRMRRVGLTAPVNPTRSPVSTPVVAVRCKASLWRAERRRAC